MQSKLQIVPLITTRKKICSMNCKTFKSIWTLFHLKKSLKEIKDSSVNYQTKEIFIICSIDWKTFYRILTVFCVVVVVKKSAKETENSLAGYQKKGNHLLNGLQTFWKDFNYDYFVLKNAKEI